MLKFIATVKIHCYDTRPYVQEFTHAVDAKRWVDAWRGQMNKAYIPGEFLDYSIIPRKR